ncbi:MAG TPA: hypothetical protein VND45_06275 [Thermoanaerobaculia bacterium]|nr:hypothetical protein [Thermoanaerobaculia bacterium]
MKLSRICLSMMIVAACAAARSAPERPWKVELTSSGGITGRGSGSAAVDSEGKIVTDRCSYEASPEELQRIETLLAQAHPERWRESYVPEKNCCDRVEYALTVDEAGKVKTTRWIDGPEELPRDLRALAEAMTPLRTCR